MSLANLEALALKALAQQLIQEQSREIEEFEATIASYRHRDGHHGDGHHRDEHRGGRGRAGRGDRSDD